MLFLLLSIWGYERCAPPRGAPGSCRTAATKAHRWEEVPPLYCGGAMPGIRYRHNPYSVLAVTTTEAAATAAATVAVSGGGATPTAAEGQSMRTDLKALADHLDPFEWVTHEAGGGGDCLYKAVSYSLHTDNAAHRALRALVPGWVRANAETVGPCLLGISAEEYAREAGTPGVWGEHVAIEALAATLRRPINCLSVREGRVRSARFEGPEDERVADAVPVYIAWLTGGHFVAVVPRTDAAADMDPRKGALLVNGADERGRVLRPKQEKAAKGKATREAARNPRYVTAGLLPEYWGVAVVEWDPQGAPPSAPSVCKVPPGEEVAASRRAADTSWATCTWVSERRLATGVSPNSEKLVVASERGHAVVSVFVTGTATPQTVKSAVAVAVPQQCVHSTRMFARTTRKDTAAAISAIRDFCRKAGAALQDAQPVAKGSFLLHAKPEAVPQLLKLSGDQGVFMRTAAEEDNLAVVWLEGATADRAREAAAAVGAKAMGLAWNGAQRYGVRTLPEDREEVESALNGGNFHARATHPLWVVSGLPPGMNWLDLEGTLRVVAGWKARAVRKLGGTGRSRLTWLVEARDPPPRLSFTVPGARAWRAEQEKLVAKLREGARTDTKRDRDTDMVDAESDRVRRRTERREEPTATQMGAIQTEQAQMRHQMSEMANAVSAIKGELTAVLEHLRTTMQPSQ